MIRIDSLYEAVHNLCRDYAAGGEPDFYIMTTTEDIQREENTGADFSADYLETLAVYRKIADRILAFDTVLIHGSAICMDGEGYLFTAKSGTGKSTHTRLWRENFGPRTRMVNDDKPLLKITDESILICGTPWDGKHHLSTNTMVPLKAICILERGEENRIWPISPAEALPRLLEQCYRPEGRAGSLKLLSLLDVLSNGTNFFRLQCNMDSEAAYVAFNGMQLSK